MTGAMSGGTIGVPNGEMNGAAGDAMMALTRSTSLISRERARGFGSRARESSVNTGSDSETMIVIGKMFAGEIEVANGTGVLRSSPGRHDQTLIETGEIGNAPIAGDRIVIDPIASGSLAPLARRCRATAIATIGTGEIGNAPTAGIRIEIAQIVRGDPTPLDR